MGAGNQDSGGVRSLARGVGAAELRGELGMIDNPVTASRNLLKSRGGILSLAEARSSPCELDGTRGVEWQSKHPAAQRDEGRMNA